MSRIFLISFLWLFSTLMMAQQRLDSLYQLATTAYEQEDHEAFLTHIRAADELRPNHPSIVGKLAAAWSLTGRKIRAVQSLRQMLLMDANFNFQQNPDFDNIRDHKDYEDLVALQERLSQVEVHDEPFRVINAASLHPESFVLLDNGEMLLGSIRERKIVKVDTNGLLSDWLTDLPYAVMGMKYQPERDELWVASAALPEMEGYTPADKGHSLILQIDVAEQKIIQGSEFDDGSLIGDLVLDSDYNYWYSNSAKPYLVRNVTQQQLNFGPLARKYFDLEGRFFNLQGLTLSEDERFLYFADYVSGIHRIDLQNDNIEKVFAPEEVLLKGIDGLYFYNNTLIAIHNGTKPYRVMQYFLDELGSTILFERVINRGGESLGEPTLGQVKDGYFYYLANSPWGKYDEEGRLPLEGLPAIEIRRIMLD